VIQFCGFPKNKICEINTSGTPAKLLACISFEEFMTPFSFSGLRSRLTLVILFSVIPAWGLMLYNAVDAERTVLRDVQDIAHRLANLAAREEEQWVEGSRQILITLAEYLRLHYDDPAACNAFFRGVLEQYKRYANLGAVRANGEVFVSAVPSTGGVTAVDREWFQHAIETREHTVSGYHVGRITEEPVLVSAYAVPGSTGQVLAVVFAAIKLKWLNAFQFDIRGQMPQGSILILIDRKGTVLSCVPESEKLLGSPLPHTNLVRKILDKGTGVMKVANANAVPWLYAFAPVQSRLKARVVYSLLGIPEKVAFGSARRALVHNLCWLGVVVLFAFVAVWFVSDRLVFRPIVALVKTTEQLARGNLGSRTGIADGRGELSELARAFDNMATRLEQHEAENRYAEEELRRSREQLRDLRLYLETAREDERTRIAMEIHDELGQNLTALKMDLASLRGRLGKNPNSAIEKIESMSKLIDMTIRDVQRISTELRPGVLDDLGLTAAVEWQCDDFQKRTGIRCEVALSDDSFVLDSDRSTAFFRILQETLTNIMRHANATKVQVSLERGKAETVLEIKDDGKGITEKEISDPKALGLIGIRERVLFFRGEFAISGTPGQGTRVRVSIPDDRGTVANDQDNHS
jgi:signal transduction histidine kinase